TIDEVTFTGLQGAAKVMAGVLFLIAVSTAWKLISFYVGGSEAGRLAADSMISGPLATNFWVFEICIGMIIPIVILVGSKFKNMQAMSSAALMALVGGFFQRYDLVVAGQLVHPFSGWDNLPVYMSYIPSAAEFLVTLGGFGLLGAGFLLGERFFGKAFRADHGH
ncbi:MAG: NrfD/PsrC family molybdoenzyme membrane anchor subunit, partial [Thermodesulfobacteriota bacterium]